MSSQALSIQPKHLQNAIAGSRAKRDENETDMRLELALGKPEDLSAYQDCIQGARIEGARGKQ